MTSIDVENKAVGRMDKRFGEMQNLGDKMLDDTHVTDVTVGQDTIRAGGEATPAKLFKISQISGRAEIGDQIDSTVAKKPQDLTKAAVRDFKSGS